jgi:RNA polymerase sigma-70 factor, ECF subfamily
MEDKRRRFERLVRALSADLFRYAMFLCRDRAMAEDVVQETFARAWRSFDALRDEGAARSWLMTTVRREWARQFERYRPSFDPIDPDRIVGHEPVDPEILALRKAVLELPDIYRDVLVLQLVGGYSGEEMSRMLKLPRATVNTRLFRARQRLKEVLEEEAPGIAGGRSIR